MKQIFRALRLPSLPALALYAATVAAEAPVVMMRMLLSIPVLAVILFLKGENPERAVGLVQLALFPTGWAVFALVTARGGGWWWRQNLGGREPSEREQTAYQDALALLGATDDGMVRPPRSWFVIDSPHPDAAVCGSTLMLSRGLIESEFLPAVIAHELGHLNTPDGRLTAAINRLIINPLPIRRQPEEAHGHTTVVVPSNQLMVGVTFFGAVIWVARRCVGFAKGGFALLVLAPFWGSYWRKREYTADQYAASLGQAEELADFLEIHALIHDHPVPLIWLTQHTHPPTELRVDRLLNHTPLAQPVAPGPPSVKAAPPGTPTAWPDGPTLTDTDPSAERAIRSAGKNLPTLSHTDIGKDTSR